MLPRLLFLTCLTAGTLAAQSVTAFTNATVIDGRGAAAQPGLTVIVRDSLIEAVGAGLPVPRGATVIDVRGKVLMPGLADMHVHLTGGWDGERTDLLGFPRYLNALLYAGVTTVQDVGNVMPYVQQMKQEIRAGRLAGPRLYMAGSLVDGADPVWPPITLSMTSVSQAPAIVRQLKGAGVDVVKAYVGLSEQLLAALVRAAAAESLGVIADLGNNNGSDWGLRAGIAAWAHAPRLPLSDATIAEMRRRGVRNITTLAVMESFARRRFGSLAFLDDSLLTQTMPPLFVQELRAHATARRSAQDSLITERWAAGLRTATVNVGKLLAAGVPLVAGTDAPYPGVWFGEGLHRELELLVEAGLTPVQAIAAATGNAAALARSDHWGVIAPGKVADLLVIDGRPHERIADTRRIALVMQSGRVLDRRRLAWSAAADPGFRAVGTALSTK